MKCPIKKSIKSGIWECPMCRKRLGSNDIIALSTWWGDDYGKCLKCGNERPAKEFKIIVKPNEH
jgi:predicted nucleic-acid-binding Zn-ribbon protein